LNGPDERKRSVLKVRESLKRSDTGKNKKEKWKKGKEPQTLICRRLRGEKWSGA
jgi:hypothetical protein